MQVAHCHQNHHHHDRKQKEVLFLILQCNPTPAQQVGKDEPLSPESDQDDYVQIQPQVCFLKVSFKGCKFDFDDTDYLSW